MMTSPPTKTVIYVWTEAMTIRKSVNSLEGQYLIVCLYEHAVIRH